MQHSPLDIPSQSSSPSLVLRHSQPVRRKVRPCRSSGRHIPPRPASPNVAGSSTERIVEADLKSVEKARRDPVLDSSRPPFDALMVEDCSCPFLVFARCALNPTGFPSSFAATIDLQASSSKAFISIFRASQINLDILRAYLGLSRTFIFFPSELPLIQSIMTLHDPLRKLPKRLHAAALLLPNGRKRIRLQEEGEGRSCHCSLDAIDDDGVLGLVFAGASLDVVSWKEERKQRRDEYEQGGTERIWE